MININYIKKYNKYKIKYFQKRGGTSKSKPTYLVIGYYAFPLSLYVNLLFNKFMFPLNC